MKKLNREYHLDINRNIDVKYGSVDRETPLVIYIEGKTWICPKHKIDYESFFNCIKDEFRHNIKETLQDNDDFCEKFIFDFDVKTASLRENKKSFMAFEFLVRQNKNVIPLTKIKPQMISTFKWVIDSLVNNLENHIFSLSKRK